MLIVKLLLTGWAAAVAAADLRHRRIPNWLQGIALLLLAVCYWATGMGPVGGTWVSGIVAAALGVAVLLPGYWFRALGAADVKLAVVAGLALGAPLTVEWLLFSAATLGLVSLAWIVGRRARRNGPAAGSVSTLHQRVPAGAVMMPVFALMLWTGSWIEVAHGT